MAEGEEKRVPCPPDERYQEACLVADLMRQAGVISDRKFPEATQDFFRFMRTNGYHIKVYQDSDKVKENDRTKVKGE